VRDRAPDPRAGWGRKPRPLTSWTGPGSGRQAAEALALGAVVAALAWWLQPRAGVPDADAYAAVVGAYSLRAGSGYRTLLGEALNHWPPGYSALLALFPEPLAASAAINRAGLALAVAGLYDLARRVGWPQGPAAGLSLALGVGFFRLLANAAKPDVLAYALYLAGLGLLGRPGFAARLAGLAVWTLLVPVKTIAVVFTPAGLLALRGAAGWAGLAAGGLAALLLVMGAVLVFNTWTLGAALPLSYVAPTVGSLAAVPLQLVTSIGRTLLTSWYGSIRAPLVLGAVAVELGVALACLATLRPAAGGAPALRRVGLATLVLSVALQVVRQFESGARLMGYGLLPLLLSWRPGAGVGTRWAAWGVLATVLAVANGTTTNSLGANDPRYASLARAAAAAGPGQPLYTNSYHLMDLHARVPSRPVEEPASLPPGAWLFRVTLPGHDAVASTVWPVSDPGPDWCPVWGGPGGALLRRAPEGC
jgi:hypothetical protein